MDVDVCVVGAGLVGSTLACYLGGRGLSVAVIDRAPLPPMEHPDFDGRAYAIAAGSQQFLAKAGLWARMPLEPCPILDIRVSDGRVARKASLWHLHFDHADGDTGPFGWMVEARSLRGALNSLLRDLPGVEVFAPRWATIERDVSHGTARLSDGRDIRARLIVAADGRKSTLREDAGIPITGFTYQQSSIVTVISHELPHRGTALEHFLPAGPFAQLPLAGTTSSPNRSAVVWTERVGTASRIMALSDAALGREVQRRLGHHLGACEIVGRRWLYPLGAMHATRYIDARLALIGDAAHGIHPIAGQGLNLGLRDAMALGDLVKAAHAAGGDWGCTALLRRYQAVRRPANLMMLAGTHSLDRMFSTEQPLIRAARDLGLAAVDALPGLKRSFVSTAMGR